MKTWTEHGYTFNFRVTPVQYDGNNRPTLVCAAIFIVASEDIEVISRTFAVGLTGNPDDMFHKIWPLSISDMWESLLAHHRNIKLFPAAEYETEHKDHVIQFVCQEMRDIRKIAVITKALMGEKSLDAIVRSKHFNLIPQQGKVILENMRVAYSLL